MSLVCCKVLNTEKIIDDYLLKECKKTYKEKIIKIYTGVNSLLEHNNLYVSPEISPTNFLDNENIIIFFFYRKIYIFDVYIPCYQIHKNSISRKKHSRLDKLHVVQFILRKK